MNSLRLLFEHHTLLFWLILAGFLLLTIIWLGVVQMRARRLEARLDEIFGDVTNENTARMLAEYLGTVRNAAAVVANMKEEHDYIAALMPSVIRHVGLVRFSPFHDTGGDQSFSLALLDGRADGVIITALHSRTDSRLYAKPVEGSRSPYSLTPEEREAMERALGGNLAETTS